MIIKMLTILLSLALDLLAICKVTDSDKDLEIVILRQQVRILQRQVHAAASEQGRRWSDKP